MSTDGAGAATPGSQAPDGELGARLRAIRQGRDLSVRALARQLDVSPSAISQIETGKIQPSVRTLYAMVGALGVSMDEALYNGREAPPRSDAATPVPAPGAEQRARKPATRAAALASMAAMADAAPPGLAVQRADNRRSITLETGVRWERLMVWDDDDTEFMEAVYDPGSSSSPADRLVRHNGNEFGLILTGTLHVTVGFDEFALQPGDSITFPSTT
ncbi:MAG: hypothetical protein QOE98_2671, partial [Gaiellaceae bacterium]|nr:hypothetical protein [Gaiellaceae bacterium]